ncbi:hypothetical protein [Nostoc sp. 106C]|uniref:hypothetical protein n=1 Tax=Nostoc sp. 106C TaxID=1932667 RepID=UPI000A3BA6B9|nr:hypothetical protein [Nostoc sp. 106C]OUL29821.1 hypothetical protein BV375_15170 [Nostoc sp. 106C]
MSPEIRSGDVLKAIEMAIPATAIEEAIANTQTEEERKRCLRLPRNHTNIRQLSFSEFNLLRTCEILYLFLLLA